ncbi:hypothetical protein [Nesterenkonia aerolata]|uniref:Tryptophan-rich sensory protein n=1 Tax=Nesterenkonia aerolata TaxID=3074079 RepID=A0ABU2DUP8_9MICC|nr:hypothetical protein [Nesterenkonia sp. LY-0111]MDR8020005.1 hypothetical protein [Nesterenkonia sp. LY-0111]
MTSNTEDEMTLATRPTATDRIRSICMGASAAAMILVPTLGPVIAGTEEGAEDFDTEITPPGYAFTIWAPIFAGVAANTIQHAARPATEINRRTGWWLTAAYSANIVWSLAAQSDRFRYTPLILPIAAGFALIGHRRAQSVELHGTDRIVSHISGLLFGWTSVASVVNAFAIGHRGRGSTTKRTSRKLARYALAGAAAGISAIIGTSRHGHTSIAAASGWAMATNAANPERTKHTRVINAACAALVLGACGVRRVISKTRKNRGQSP